MHTFDSELAVKLVSLYADAQESEITKAIVSVCIEAMSQQGDYKVNLCIYEHAEVIYKEEELKELGLSPESDLVTIQCNDRGQIGLEEILVFIRTVDKIKLPRERSYYFEGIVEDIEENTHVVCWGS